MKYFNWLWTTLFYFPCYQHIVHSCHTLYFLNQTIRNMVNTPTRTHNLGGIWTTPFYFPCYPHIVHSCHTLYLTHIKISIFSLVMMFRGKKLTKVIQYFLNQTIRNMVNTPTWIHNLGRIWNLCHCTQVLH